MKMLKVTLLSSLRSLTLIVLQSRKAPVFLLKCLSSSPNLSQMSRKVRAQTYSTCCSLSFHFCDTVLLICCLYFPSVVFAVQVKVEEVEMETPIDPPDNPQQVSLDVIKQEEGMQGKSVLYQPTEQSRLKNLAYEHTEQSETAALRSEESGSMEDSLTDGSNMEQSDHKETSGLEKNDMDDISEGNTEQDTPGEAARMEG